jgi:hypothetical protein
MTQLSAREIIPFGNHFGNAPLLSISLVVIREPEGVHVREMTSQEMTWEA